MRCSKAPCETWEYMADVLDGDHRNRPKNYAPYSLTPSACLFPEGPVAPAGGQDYLEMIDCELFDTPWSGLILGPNVEGGEADAERA